MTVWSAFPFRKHFLLFTLLRKSFSTVHWQSRHQWFLVLSCLLMCLTRVSFTWLWCYFILGWWFVNVDEEQGWVPAAYLESEDGNTDEFENITVSSGGQPLIYNTHNICWICWISYSSYLMHSVWIDLSLIFISVFLYLLERLITATSYKAELDDEISFEAGVLVTVLEKNFDGWWLIRWVFWPVLLTSPYNTFWRGDRIFSC